MLHQPKKPTGNRFDFKWLGIISARLERSRSGGYLVRWWVVSQRFLYMKNSINGGSVHYLYTFTHSEHDASNLILEVSDNFTIADITQISGDLTWADVEVGTYFDTGNSNQGMPGTVYGIKFDASSSYTDNGDGTITETYEFESKRLPTWGDFYARCGIHPDLPEGHGTWDAAWNTGFLSGEITHANDLNDGFHIAVPDTVVPEPSTGLLLAAGLIGLAGVRRNRA